MSKVIQECSGFALFRYMIGPATRATSLTNQIQTKTNRDLVTCVFPCFRRFASFHFEFSWAPCDIFLAMIGCCGCFGFGFTTLNRKVLWVSLFHFSMKTLSVMDSTPGAVYPKIVSIVNEELFSLQVCKMRNVYFRLGTEWQQCHKVIYQFSLSSVLHLVYCHKWKFPLSVL